MGKKIAIIGAGPGGYVAAIRAAQLGAEVTVVENDGVGGTCLNWGCIPSKVMIKTAQLFDDIQRASEFGIEIQGPVLPDIKKLVERKEKIVQGQARGILGLFEKHSIRYINGNGSILDKHQAVAHLPDGGKIEIPWDRLILAPGSGILEIPLFPFDGNRILSSNDALNLKEIPRSILVVGGGAIGCEFASILSSLGSKVFIVEALSRLLPLPSVDQDCSKILEREMKKRKIKIMTRKTAVNFEEIENALRVTLGPSPLVAGLKEKDKKSLVIDVEKVLVCVGRRPNTQSLGLERLGVSLDAKGWIKVNQRMETDQPNVYAIGDVLGPAKVMLAHVASHEGIVAAENAMGGSRVMDYRAVPGAIFTMPEVANAGLTESQAQEQGLQVRSDTVLFRSIGKPHVLGEIAGQVKIVSDAEKGSVLGVHIIGPHASDLIAEGTLAIQTGATIKDLADTIHTHPTLSEIVMETAHKAMGKSLHG